MKNISFIKKNVSGSCTFQRLLFFFFFAFFASAIRFDDFVCNETISAAAAEAPMWRKVNNKTATTFYFILFLFIPAVKPARSSAN